VVAASFSGRLLLAVVVISCIVIGSGGGVDIFVIGDHGCICSCTSIHHKDWMLQMISQLIASRSTRVHFVGVVAVGRKGRVQCEVVLGSGGGVVGRGSCIIVVGADQSTMRICLIARCQKGKFSMSAAMVW